MRDPKTLKVFEKADELALAVYRVTACMPPEEKYALTSQIRRAAVSVPSNLVEGCSRSSQRDFTRFVEIALGSAMELEYQLGLAVRIQENGREEHLAGIPEEAVRKLVEKKMVLSAQRFRPTMQLAAEVVKMLIAFQQTLRE